MECRGFMFDKTNSETFRHVRFKRERFSVSEISRCEQVLRIGLRWTARAFSPAWNQNNLFVMEIRA